MSSAYFLYEVVYGYPQENLNREIVASGYEYGDSFVIFHNAGGAEVARAKSEGLAVVRTVKPLGTLEET